MKQIMTKIRTAVLVGAGVVTAGIMGLFGLMMLGSVLFLALVLTPLGALAAWALQTKLSPNESTKPCLKARGPRRTVHDPGSPDSGSGLVYPIAGTF